MLADNSSRPTPHRGGARLKRWGHYVVASKMGSIPGSAGQAVLAGPCYLRPPMDRVLDRYGASLPGALLRILRNARHGA